MKHFYSTVILLLCLLSGFSQTPTVCVVTNQGSTGLVCPPNGLDPQPPCAPINFTVNYTLPPEYVVVAKYEWYINNTLVKTTQNPGDPVLEWFVKSNITDAYCKVTYKKSDNSVSQAYQSNTFRVLINALNIKLNGPGSLPIGTQTASFSLLPGAPSECPLCYTPPASAYSASWQLPAGWTITSNTNNGQNITVTTNDFSSGTVTATATMGCGYTTTRTINVTRIYPTPTFAATNPNPVCGATTETFSINPVPMASNYTYTISGGTGWENVTFAANGLQTLTTNSTSVVLNFPSSSIDNYWCTLNVIANFPNGATSGANTLFSYNAPSINWDPSFNLAWMQNCPPQDGADFTLSATEMPGAQAYYWYIDGFLFDVSSSPFTAGKWYTGNQSITVEAKTPCGFTPQRGVSFSEAVCPNMMALKQNNKIAENNINLYPNPASSRVNITLKNDPKIPVPNSIKEIRQIIIFDKMGNMVKSQQYAKGTRSVILETASLKADVYVIMVTDGINKKSVRLSKVE